MERVNKLWRMCCLSDHSNKRIIYCLKDGEKTVSQIEDELKGYPKNLIDSRLKDLEEYEIVESCNEEEETYRINQDGFKKAIEDSMEILKEYETNFHLK